MCGGREYTNTVLAHDTLYELNFDGKEDCIIAGGARGADELAKQFGYVYDIPVEIYHADWETYGKAAGYIRNKTMLEEGKPDMVVAFAGGKGTAMMVKIAREAGVPVLEVE